MRSSKRIYKYCCVDCGSEYFTHDKHSESCPDCCDSDEKVIIIKESKEKTKFTFNDVDYLG